VKIARWLKMEDVLDKQRRDPDQRHVLRSHVPGDLPAELPAVHLYLHLVMHPRHVMVTLKVVPKKTALEVNLEVRATPYQCIRCLLQCGKPDRCVEHDGKAEYRRVQLRSGCGVDLGGVVEGKPTRLEMQRAHMEPDSR
jgi:hypothetical protein